MDSVEVTLHSLQNFAWILNVKKSSILLQPEGSEMCGENARSSGGCNGGTVGLVSSHFSLSFPKAVCLFAAQDRG